MPTDPEEEPVYVEPSDQHSVLVFNPELMQEIEREIAAEPRGSDEGSSDTDGDHCDRLNEGNIFDVTVSGISGNTTEQSAHNSELELNTEIESQTPENVSRPTRKRRSRQ